MPTYTYACRNCDHRFDAVQSIFDPSLSSCPLCEGPLRKVYEPVGVTFKGSGFYRTDSRAGKKAPAPSPVPSPEPSPPSRSKKASSD
jgi:putative FmdB family regulatory protein